MSKTHDKIVDFYRNLLLSVNVHETENGVLTSRAMSKSTPDPISVTDKSLDPPVDKWLAMPTKPVLARLNDDNLMGFNPLAESNTRGESEVFQKLKDLIIFRINTVVWQLVKMLVNEIALNTKKYESLDSNQMEFLSKALAGEQPTKNFIGKFEKLLLASAKGNSNGRFVNIYIKRNAKQAGVVETYNRAAIVSFPLAKEVAKDSVTILDVTFAKYEVKILNALFEALLPGITEQDTYSQYGNPVMAPNFTILLQSWNLIATRLNDVSNLFKDMLLDDDDIINLDWFADMNQLPKWNGIIPTLSGNVGEGGDEERAKPAATPRHMTPTDRRREEERADSVRIEAMNGAHEVTDDGKVKLNLGGRGDSGGDIRQALRDISRREDRRDERSPRRERAYGRVRDERRDDSRDRYRYDDRDNRRYDSRDDRDYDRRPRRYDRGGI